MYIPICIKIFILSHLKSPFHERVKAVSLHAQKWLFWQKNWKHPQTSRRKWRFALRLRGLIACTKYRSCTFYIENIVFLCKLINKNKDKQFIQYTAWTYWNRNLNELNFRRCKFPRGFFQLISTWRNNADSIFTRQ